jgi:hypothetical protein
VTIAIHEDGWVRVPYDGPELGIVEIGIGEDAPVSWKPAFLDTIGSVRYAQVRPFGFLHGMAPRVWIRVNGAETLLGRLGEVATDQRSRRR